MSYTRPTWSLARCHTTTAYNCLRMLNVSHVCSPTLLHMQRSNSILPIYAMPWPVTASQHVLQVCTHVVNPQISVLKALFPFPSDLSKEDIGICKYIKERLRTKSKSKLVSFLNNHPQMGSPFIAPITLFCISNSSRSRFSISSMRAPYLACHCCAVRPSSSCDASLRSPGPGFFHIVTGTL